jgi:nucleotide-binding universal stress UspA family protein
MTAEKQRILCGTDFSIHAAEAASVAARLALERNETLVLVHVLNEPNQWVSGKSQAELRTMAQARLDEEAARLRKMGATVKAELVEGSPAVVLAEAGDRARTRLIVVSSLGMIAASRFFRGSTAERVAENSSIPTLIVRATEPFEAWLSKQRPLNILCGTDFSESSRAAIEFVIELRRLAPCQITIAHVNWPPEERERHGIHQPSPLTENPAEIQALLEKELAQHTAGLADGDGDITRLVEPGWGRVDGHLLQIASRIKADLIVTGTHQRAGLTRFWLGSVSRGVLRHAPMSVAIVPTPEAAERESR